MRALLLAASAVLVAMALGLSHGSVHPGALTLVLAAAACAAGSLGVQERDAAPVTVRLTSLGLGAGLVAGFAYGLILDPGWRATHSLLPAFRPVLLVAAAVVATHLWPRPPAALVRLRPALLAVLWLVLVALVLRGPAPTIDVWDLQQGGVEGLLRGENPYALGYPNRYGPETRVLAREVLSSDRLQILAYPYPPLTLAAGLATAFTGDVRWAYAALTLLSAAGIWLLGRRTRVAELAAALVLFQPAGYLLVEQAWTEPLVLACLVGLALAVGSEPSPNSARPEPFDYAASGGYAQDRQVEGRAALDWALPGVMAGLALTAKQYSPLLLVPFLAALPARDRLRAMVISVAVALAVYVPFALWDPGALWRSLVGFHLAQPFRKDSLSLAAWVYAWNGAKLPAWPGFLAAGLVLAVSWRRIRGVAEALAVAALAWLVFLLLAKQAFANYYGLAVGLLCAAAASAAVEARESVRPERRPAAGGP